MHRPHQIRCAVGLAALVLIPPTASAQTLTGAQLERVNWNNQPTRIAETNLMVQMSAADPNVVFLNVAFDLNDDGQIADYAVGPNAPGSVQAEWVVRNIPLFSAPLGIETLQSMPFGLADGRLFRDGHPLNIDQNRIVNAVIVLSPAPRFAPLPLPGDVFFAGNLRASPPFGKLPSGGGKETPTPPTLPPSPNNVIPFLGPNIPGPNIPVITDLKIYIGVPDNPQDQDDGTDDKCNPNPGQPWGRRGHDECGPTAAANSFRWMAKVYGFNNKLPPEPNDPNLPVDPNDPNAAGPPPDKDLISELVKKMDTNGTRTGRGSGEPNDPNGGTNDDDFVLGKGLFIYCRDLPVSIQFKDGNTKIANVPPMAPDPNFIWNLLGQGKDVELGMTFVGGGGHWVTAVGGVHFADGSKYIAIHDPDDDQKKKPKTDVYCLGTRVVNGVTYVELLGYGIANFVDIVVGECPTPTPHITEIHIIEIVDANDPIDTGPFDTTPLAGDGPYRFAPVPGGLVTMTGVTNQDLPESMFIDPNSGAVVGTAPPGSDPNQAINVLCWVTETDTGKVVAELWWTIFIRVVPPPPVCPGDADGDLDVDLTDLAIVLGHFGQSPATRAEGDLNGDGVVNLSDLAIVLANFGRTCP